MIQNTESMNIRRKFKHLLKNHQRSYPKDRWNFDYINEAEFIAVGLYVRGWWDISNILSTNIHSRVISRIARAAKKKRQLLPLEKMYDVWAKKNGKLHPKCQRFEEAPDNYHLIKFYGPKYITEKVLVTTNLQKKIYGPID